MRRRNPVRNFLLTAFGSALALTVPLSLQPAQADETWSDGNHVAASCAGMPRMKICEMATMVCPAKTIGKPSGFVPKTLIQLPRQVPNEPKSTDLRKP